MILLRYFGYVTLSALFCVCVTHAQTKPNTENSTLQSEQQVADDKKNAKKQSINFEDELVEGSAQKPEFFYLFQKKNYNYKRLIRLRENFIPEMSKTSENVQRLRGGR